MGEFTSINCGLWEWEPFISLPPRERVLWLALYTSGTTKRICTGLWHGGIHSIAHAAKLEPDDAWVALGTLITRKLVVHDHKLCVLRLTVLPDAGDRPSSWKALKGMWTGFKSVPKCNVRDSHVTLMRWLIDQGTVSDDMERTWAETFGTIPHTIPLPSSKLTDCDTSTDIQPGLWSSQVLDRVSIPQVPEQEPDRDQDQVLDQVQVQVPEPERVAVTKTGNVLKLVPEPTREDVKRSIIAVIGPHHAVEFNEVRAVLNSPVRNMSVVDRFDQLRSLLDALPSLETALEDCRYAIAIRKAEAIATQSMKRFGNGMWDRNVFDISLSMAPNDVATDAARADRSGRGVGPTQHALTELAEIQAADKRGPQ